MILFLQIPIGLVLLVVGWQMSKDSERRALEAYKRHLKSKPHSKRSNP